MPIGQSAGIAAIASGITKRGSYLYERACGSDRVEADLKSDEYAIAAAYTAGTASAVLTADPVGLAGTVALAAGMENDLALKKEGK